MGTNSQRRRMAALARRMERRRRPGWAASLASAKAVVPHDPHAAMKRLDAELDSAGMVRVSR